MTTPPKPHLTPAEYLAIERGSERKHEYFAGEMFAMTGASEEHNLIAGNVLASLHQQFKGRACKVYQSDMRVKIDATGLYTYPDVVAVCGKAEFEDSEVDTLLNPNLAVEVLSDSTEAYDRGKKFQHYRKVPSLRDYVLIAQDRRHVELYVRLDDGHWMLSECNDVSGSIKLPSIQCSLAMGNVYDKLEFDSPSKRGWPL